jgi:ketosteroid isomerase-like protein
VVVLPAPLGPRKAKISPALTSRSMPRTASKPSYDLRSPLTLITESATARAILGGVRFRPRPLRQSASMASENAEVVRRTLLAFNRGDLQTALELVDPAIRVYPRPEEPGVKEVYAGHEGMFEYVGNWYGQWDDYAAEPVTFEDVPGDRVLVVMAERGHLKKTGITIDEQFSHSYTVKNGKLTEWRMYDSSEQAREALGLD